jgi:hypothetical protein
LVSCFVVLVLVSCFVVLVLVSCFVVLVLVLVLGAQIEAERLEKRPLHLQRAAGKERVAVLAGGHPVARNDAGGKGLAGTVHVG